MEKHRGSSLGFDSWLEVCFIWNFINQTPCFFISFLCDQTPPATRHPSPLKRSHCTNQRRQKSLWAEAIPRANDILFTNTLSCVTWVMVIYTVALCSPSLIFFSFYSNELWPNEVLNVATPGKNRGTLKRKDNFHNHCANRNLEQEQNTMWEWEGKVLTSTQTLALLYFQSPQMEKEMCHYPKGKFTI